MAGDTNPPVSWEVTRRIRSIRHIAVHLTPRSQPEHVLTLLLVGTKRTASRPPILLYCSTLDTADPSPEFPEIAFSAAANSSSEQYLNYQSKVRILVLSHARQQFQGQDIPNGCDTRGHRAGWKNGASCLPTHVPFQWHCEPLQCSSDTPDNVHRSHSSWQQESAQTSRRSAGLPTIRESRSFNNSRLSSDGPRDTNIRGLQAEPATQMKSPFTAGPGPPSSSSAVETSGGTAESGGPISARFSIQGGNYCAVQLDVACASAQRNGASSTGTDRAHQHGAGEQRQVHSNGVSDSAVACDGTEIASNALCTWELRALNPQEAQCLVDASLDLGTDLTSVQMPFSSLHCCSVLPMHTLMLGLGNSTHVGTARHAIVNSGLQPAALFLHPKLPDPALLQFIEDNKRTNKEWPEVPLTRRPTQSSHGAGVLDLIRNALPFPLPFPSSRSAKVPARPMPRNRSSPSLQPGTSPGSTHSLPLPGSNRDTHASRQRTKATRFNRTPTDSNSATLSRLSNTPKAVTSPLAGSGELSAHFRKDSNSAGASEDSVWNDSESESESDSQTFYGVARQQPRGRANVVTFQATLPAMQYCAFMIPPAHEQARLQRAAEQRILGLQTRINAVLNDSRGRLELSARVKQLQVRAQQMRSWSDGLTKKLLSTRRAVASRKQRLSARSRRLQCASGDDGPLAAALKRSRDLRLCYPDMMYCLRRTHGLLTTRRNSLVISLFHHFRLQPMALKAYTDGVLSDMQDLWMHQQCLNPQKKRAVAGGTFTSLQTATSSPGSSPSPRSHSRRASRSSISPTRLSLGGSNSFQRSQVDGITARLTPVMTIMGLLCSPDVARRAQLGELGLDTSQPLQVDRLNAAYGLIAQVVVFLGVILDTPPLFHIVLDGSACRIQQHIPKFSRHGTVEPELNEEDTQDRILGPQPIEHPLHVEQGKHDKLKKFAWACFLLGSDVQLVLHEHDILPYGQQFLLENLEKLVAAARMSGLKPEL